MRFGSRSLAGGLLLVGLSGAAVPVHGSTGADCGFNDDYKEAIPFWPDRYWHAGEGTSYPFPEPESGPSGEFIWIQNYYMYDAHEAFEQGYGVNVHGFC